MRHVAEPNPYESSLGAQIRTRAAWEAQIRTRAIRNVRHRRGILICDTLLNQIRTGAAWVVKSVREHAERLRSVREHFETCVIVEEYAMCDTLLSQIRTGAAWVIKSVREQAERLKSVRERSNPYESRLRGSNPYESDPKCALSSKNMPCVTRC